NRTMQDYTERHYLPAAAAYQYRAADKGALGRQVLDWCRDLEKKWAAARFGKAKIETAAAQHLFEIQVYLGGLEPDAVQVELYADGANGSAAVRQVMARVGPLAGAVNGF